MRDEDERFCFSDANHMKTILLISPYWKEPHRWMVSTVKLAALWQQLGYRVVVACMGAPVPGAEGDGRTSVQRVSDTLTIYRMRDVFFADPWNYGVALGFGGFVMRIVRTERPDVMVINKLLFWTSLAGIRLRLARRRFTLITDAFVGQTWWPRGLLPKIAAFLYAWTLGWLVLLLAERVVTFHPQPERLLKRMGIAGKTRVIPTGIDPAPYAGEHVPSEHITITYIGRLESVKGVDDFLAATVPLREQFPSVTVQVVGWYREFHPLVMRYRGRVTFTGLRDDIPRVLAETDIFVLPSYSEGLSNALMEAMASGCACVASEVGGNRFLVQNGVSGLLFPAGDREALAAHIRRLIQDPSKRRMLGEAARRRIQEQFSWDVVGRMYRELFEESPAQ